MICFVGKIVLIIGVVCGIGKVFVVWYVVEGVIVVIGDINLVGVKVVVIDIGLGVYVVELDVIS